MNVGMRKGAADRSIFKPKNHRLKMNVETFEWAKVETFECAKV